MHCDEHGTLDHCPECIAEEEAKQRNWLIWSNEHMGWWKPAAMGYTSYRSEAGRYTREEAGAICYKANLTVPDNGVPNEIMTPEHEQ